MRTLVLLRGTPAVGKSTFIKENNLEQYTICPDNIRLMVQSPITDIKGNHSISQKNDGKVWDILFDMLEDRMKRGEFVVIDATHSRNTLLNRYRELTKFYRYRIVVVNFEKPLDVILEQNKNRDEYKFVPEDVIVKIFNRLKFEKIPKWCTSIKPNEFSKTIELPVYDFSSYEKVNIYGDVHGCYSVTNKTFEKYNTENSFHIFLGDYFDRGIENVEMFKFLMKIKDYKNVLLLTGNHELHIFDYLDGKEIRSMESKKTFTQFEENGITKKDIQKLVHKLAQHAYFKYNDKTYVVNHGGIPCLPNIKMSTNEMIKGVGSYTDNIEMYKSFLDNTNEETILVHGHRNVFKEDICESDYNNRIYNLCDTIEFGGYLRTISISNEGIICNKIKNDIFNTEPETTPTTILKDDKVYSNETIIESLRQDRFIIEKDLGNNVSSFNFSKKAFQKKIWNNMTTKARGLFVDIKTNEIVARSYDKFFNDNEKSKTKLRLFSNSDIKYPIKAYHKYNGYLGILSVNNDEWFVASKSTTQGDFAENFRKILDSENILTDDLKSYILENNVSLIFEVIDVEKDRHIIEYDKSHTVLLDVIKNEFKFEKLNDEDLWSFASDYNFKNVKELLYTINNFKDYFNVFNNIKHDITSENMFIENLEGYVLIDDNGYTWKLKGSYYSFWKAMRGLKDRVVKKYKQNAGELFKSLHSSAEVIVFNRMIEMCEDDEVSFKESHIIDIKNQLK